MKLAKQNVKNGPKNIHVNLALGVLERFEKSTQFIKRNLRCGTTMVHFYKPSTWPRSFFILHFCLRRLALFRQLYGDNLRSL